MNMKMRKILMKKYSSIIITRELPTEDAQPGIARSVVSLILIIMINAIRDARMAITEATRILTAIMSVKTASAPKP
jgi:hypothetical protein